ncbi:hypothetical protein CRV24_001839 [Beauveria bassiana]|nr:hypothetical protein CRV24_001839 [Beauveria bassiana]KAH8717176.1 hypothetical protein HC256_001880 [Beauveria bassiana]
MERRPRRNMSHIPFSCHHTLVFVAACSNEADHPALCDFGILGNGLDNVVLEDKDDGKEDDVGGNDKDNGDAAPLQGNNALDAAVGLARGHGADAICVGWQARALSRGGAVGQGRQVDLYAVAKGSKGGDDGDAGKDEQRNPEVGEAVVVVDVANGAEAKGDTTEDESEDDADERDAPAGGLGKVHEGAADADLPAYLQVQGEGAQKCPHDAAPAAEDEKATRGAADGAGLHAVRGDSVVALVRAGGERHDEAHVHEEDGAGEADAEVVAVRFVDGQQSPREEQVEAAEGADGGGPVGDGTDGAEAIGVDPFGERAGQAAGDAFGDFLAEAAVDDWKRVSGGVVEGDTEWESRATPKMVLHPLLSG